MSDPVRLGDVTLKIGSGATPRGGKGVYVDSGTALIRSQNVYDNAFSFDGLAFITEPAAHALRGVTVEPGDVLINITGESVTRTCIVDPDVLPARVSQHVAIIRPDHEILDSHYLEAVLLSPDTKNHLNLLSSGGATRRALTKVHLESLLINLPPLEDQRAIAAVLQAVGGVIERDHRLATEVMDLAAALYRDACADSTAVRVGDSAAFHNRRRIPLSSAEREKRKGDVPYYGATGVFGFVDEALFDEVLVLVGEDGSVVSGDGTPVLQYIWGKAWINNHAHPLTGVGISTELLYLALRHTDVRPLVTGAVQAKISMGNLKHHKVQIPSGIALQRLEAKIAPLFTAFRELTNEVQELTSAKNELLPLLVSGRVRVRDVGQVA